MSKKTLFTIACLATAIFLTSCGEPPPADNTNANPAALADATPAPTSPRQSYEEFTSITSDVVEGFTHDIQKAFKKGDWKSIAPLIDYPITINGKEFTSEEQFLKANKKKLIPQKTRNKIAKANYHTMEVSKKGAKLGDGELWIGGSQLLRIIEINVE